jgi:L-fuconolactonase
MIDAHIHFWNLSRSDDILILRREPSLARQSMPPDLLPLMSAEDVSAAVAIQSAPDPGETDHLIKVCAEVHEIRAVVGWVDLTAPDAGTHIRALAGRSKVTGVRAMLNRVESLDWLASERVRPGLAALKGTGLSLDVIARAEHASAIAAVAEAMPQLLIIVDHGASPPLRRQDRSDWIAAIERLGRIPSITTKFSGIAEEAPENWTALDLEPAFRHLLACFGAERIMWASNWPVIDLRGGYAKWAAASRQLLDRAGLSGPDRRSIEGEAARRIYRLGGA